VLDDFINDILQIDKLVGVINIHSYMLHQLGAFLVYLLISLKSVFVNPFGIELYDGVADFK